MNRMQKQVTEFHLTMDLPAPDSPEIDWEDTNGIRGRLIVEETLEWEEAAYLRDPYNSIKEACDILYVVFGWAVACGIDLAPFMDEVHKSNMAKAGGPKRADGKPLKPEGWVAPDMKAIFEKVYGEGIKEIN